jgi:hypothetical protein
MLLIQDTVKEYGYDPSLLSHGSNKKCVCSCDYCGARLTKKYFKWVTARKYVKKDSCGNNDCRLRKQEENNLSKIGVKHHSQTQEYKDKYKKTCVGRYGIDNPFRNTQKIKEAVQKKFGVDNAAKLDAVKEKRMQTNLQRYGVRHPYQNQDILDRVRKKIKEKYGVEHYAQTRQFKDEFSEKNKLSYQEINEHCAKKNYIPLFSSAEYISARQILPFRCRTHSCEFKTQVHYGSKARDDNQCPKCKLIGVSRAEQEIYDFVKQYFPAAILNDRKTLYPFELDIHIPEKALAIEYHGLYWHSEQQKNKRDHLEKFLLCKEKGIQLLQFFEDEWRDKQNICKSIIKAKLGVLEDRIHARKLTVVESSSENKKLFGECFSLNHLQGNCRHIKAFALIDELGVIQQCISLRRPFISGPKRVIEIARSVSKVNTSVVGGFQRLLKRCVGWAAVNNYEVLLTYSDCRYSHGEAYRKAGFEFIGPTVVDYFYTDNVNRFNRFKFRAKDGQTEKEIAKENNVYKIYGAGNYRWEMKMS